MASQAIVARATDEGLEFLAERRGKVDWTSADHDARNFDTVREATRAAMQLPSRYRAFALPGDAAGWRSRNRLH